MTDADLRGYSIAFARDIISAKMGPYSSALPPIYAKYAGKYLAVASPGRGVEHLHGDWGLRAVMIAEFPDVAAVDGFWWGPEYRAAAKLREGAVKVDAGRLAGRTPVKTDQAVLVVALRVADGSRAADALRQAAASAAGATLLAPVSDDALQVLEGDFAGHAVGFLSFVDLDAARAGWQAMVPALQARAASLQAYALPRAPGG
jgi:uncharacterized protein (DUF1330 family)